MKGLLNKPLLSVERVTARYQQQYVERLSCANTFNLCLLHCKQALCPFSLWPQARIAYRLVTLLLHTLCTRDLSIALCTASAVVCRKWNYATTLNSCRLHGMQAFARLRIRSRPGFENCRKSSYQTTCLYLSIHVSNREALERVSAPCQPS